ncbi:MAG: hypothetical protein ACYDGR_07925 [Candidatus Dormibacteria bacterium]
MKAKVTTEGIRQAVAAAIALGGLLVMAPGSVIPIKALAVKCTVSANSGSQGVTQNPDGTVHYVIDYAAYGGCGDTPTSLTAFFNLGSGNLFLPSWSGDYGGASGGCYSPCGAAAADGVASFDTPNCVVVYRGHGHIFAIPNDTADGYGPAVITRSPTANCS